MTSIREIGSYLEEFAPRRLAEDWDNVGHLVGDEQRIVERAMTCLTVTPASVAEAVATGVDLIIAHHPFPFRPLKRITAATVPGKLLLDLISAGIAVYSPHTAFDSAALGINQRLAEALELVQIRPLEPLADDPQGLGAGRWGLLPHRVSVMQLGQRLKAFLSIDDLHIVGGLRPRVTSVAVACGSAGSLLETAHRQRCEVFVTGETSFHTCLEAEALGMSLLLPGHYPSERFAVEQLAHIVAERFPQVSVWASRRESDPVRWG
jgi:dinuclear metal center YbgI/SA1388 family protein